MTILRGSNLPLTWFWHFWQLMGCNCSYLLPRQDGRNSLKLSQWEVVTTQNGHPVPFINTSAYLLQTSLRVKEMTCTLFDASSKALRGKIKLHRASRASRYQVYAVATRTRGGRPSGAARATSWVGACTFPIPELCITALGDPNEY